MNENKTIKVSLGTVFCLCIIFLLVIALIYMHYNQNKNEVINNVNNEDIALKNSYNEENLIQNNANIQESNNIIYKNEFIPLSIYTANKKVTDNNREGYSIRKEKDGVCLSIRDGKAYFTSFLDNDM